MSDVNDDELAEAVADKCLDIDLTLFANFLKLLKARGTPPAECDRWQKSFDEYLSVGQKVCAEMGIHANLPEVERRIPNNEWILILHDAMRNSPPRHPVKVSTDCLEDLKNRARANRRHKDTN